MGNNEGGQWQWEQRWQRQPVGSDPIIIVVAMAVATCRGGVHYSRVSVDGGGCRQSAAVAAAVLGGGWRRRTVSMAVEGTNREPPPLLLLAVARQTLADNGGWPAESWWEAELFTNKIVGALR